jgi:hypothetical protein
LPASLRNLRQELWSIAQVRKEDYSQFGVLLVTVASVAVVHLPGFIPIIVTLAIVT